MVNNSTNISKTNLSLQTIKHKKKKKMTYCRPSLLTWYIIIHIQKCNILLHIHFTAGGRRGPDRMVLVVTKIEVNIKISSYR